MPEELENNFDEADAMEAEALEENNGIDELDNNSLDSDKEEAIEAAADDEEAKAEAERKAYGEKVSKRISKEVSKRKALEDQLYNLQTRFEEQEARFSKKEIEENNAGIEQRLSELAKKRKEMYELGDIDPDIEDRYQDLRFEQKQAKQPVKQEQPVQRQAPQAQQEWLSRNSWYGAGDERQQTTNDALQEMLNEGWDVNHPGTYAQLDKRLNPDREAAPAPAAPTPKSIVNKKKPQLTKSDLDEMSNYGLDSSNPIHRKEWLKNKGAA